MAELSRKSPANALGKVAIAFLAILIILGGMLWSVYYQLPDGLEINFIGFIKLWFRELVITGALILALIIVGFRRWSRGSTNRKQSVRNVP